MAFQGFQGCIIQTLKTTKNIKSQKTKNHEFFSTPAMARGLARLEFSILNSIKFVISILSC